MSAICQVFLQFSKLRRFLGVDHRMLFSPHPCLIVLVLVSAKSKSIVVVRRKGLDHRQRIHMTHQKIKL